MSPTDTGTETNELLRALTNSRLFTEFACAFTEATGLPLALRPADSLQLSFHGQRNQAPFCALMAGENRACAGCLQSQAKAAAAAQGAEGSPVAEKSHTAVCYAGLSEIVVPFRLGNRLIGFLWTGQVFERPPGERQFRGTLKLLRSWGINLDENLLREAYFGTRQISREVQAAAIKLLTIFAEHLAMISNELVIQRENCEPPMVTRAKEFIREHYTERLTLPQVARFANSSPYHFCKQFKRATGVTFTKYVSRVRIESCKARLINPQVRVSEVAYEAGFQSLTHFNRVFSKMLGQSPTEYRDQLRTRISGVLRPARQ